jgi:hypothetical protein
MRNGSLIHPKKGDVKKMVELRTVRIKPADVGKDVAGLCRAMDSRTNDIITIRKCKVTGEFFVYFESEAA